MTIINIVLTALTALLVLASVFSKKLKIAMPGHEGKLTEKTDTFCERWCYVILAFIVVLGAFVMVYRLDEIFEGIHVDEASEIYTTYALMEHGVDRFLNHNPLYCLTFERGGSSALGYYIAGIFSKVLGSYSLFAHRFVNAFFGICGILGGFFLGKTVHGKRTGLFCAFLCATLPIFMFFMVFVLLAFIKGAQTRKTRWYVLAGTLCGIIVDLYDVAMVLIPLVLVFVLAYLISARRISFKQIVCMGIPAFLITLPLILYVLINFEIIPEINNPLFSIPKMAKFTGGEVGFAKFLPNLLSLYRLLTEDAHPYNALPQYYTLYLMSIPLVLYGIFLGLRETIVKLKKREFSPLGVVLSVSLACILCSLLAGDLVIYRASTLYASLMFFITVAVRRIKIDLKDSVFSIIAGYLLCFAMYCNYYFNHFNEDYPILEFVQRNGVEAYSYTKERFPDRQLYFTALQPDFYKYAYIYPLLANLEDPYVFQETFVDKWSSNEYGNNHFYLPIQLLSDGSLFYEIYDDAVYVLNTNYATETFNSCDAALIEAGFTKEEMAPYNIYYKD